MATVDWIELTSSGQAFSAGTTVTDTSWGSSNMANMTASSFPIAQGARSFFKQQTLYVTALDPGESVQNPLIYLSSGTVTAGDFLYFDDLDSVTSVNPDITSIGTTSIGTLGSESVISGNATSISSAPNGFRIFRTQISVGGATTSGASGLTLTLTYEVVS